ncbi:MAG: hypothetical protein Q9171_001842 [Xanthocarpia ochracea]
MVCLNGLITASPRPAPKVLIRDDPTTSNEINASGIASEFASLMSLSKQYSRCLIDADQQYNSLLERRTMPPDRRAGEPYHVPNTQTTLIVIWEGHSTGILPALRELLYKSRTEIESIIDVVGDGIIPGDWNEYDRFQVFERGLGPEAVSIDISGRWNRYVQERLLTYRIALDVLRGLWDLTVAPRREQKIHSVKVIHSGKLVAAAILNFGPDPSMATA